MKNSEKKEEILAWFRLINSKGIGPKTFWELLKRYGDAQTSLKYVHNAFSEKEAIKILKGFEGYILLASDPSYPAELKALPYCPPMLFVKGNLKILKGQRMAIIGARNASIYGKAMADKLGFELSHHFSIISGLANGIDTSAHKGALRNPEARPLAVMPFSLNNVYPKENKLLFDQIAERGLVISEVPPHRIPDQGMFLARNRIVATLSSGIITIEAALNSGTTSTAKLALDMGKEVMAVPGSPVDPRSKGCNMLIKNGAPLIEDFLDVLEIMGSSFSKRNEKIQLEYKKPTENNLGAKILDMLSVGSSLGVDFIAHNLRKDVGVILSEISELEIQGKIIKCSTNEVMLNVERN